MGLNCVGVPMDADGVIPAALNDMLTRWEEVYPGTARPKLIILVPYVINLSSL